MVLILKFSLI
jgi:hypothetical protein